MASMCESLWVQSYDFDSVCLLLRMKKCQIRICIGVSLGSSGIKSLIQSPFSHQSQTKTRIQLTLFRVLAA